MKFSDIKISVIALGCNKNQVDAELLIAKLASKFSLTASLKEADVIVLLPCAFLKSARKEAYEYIRELSRYKKITDHASRVIPAEAGIQTAIVQAASLKGRCRCLVVAGCFASMDKKGLVKKIPEINIVLDLKEMGEFEKHISKFLRDKTNTIHCKKRINGFSKAVSKVHRLVPSNISTFIKIADGCSNRCSYCLIPLIKGPLKSRTQKEIIEEMRFLAEQGVQEFNIIAQDIGLYGVDRGEKHGLYNLLKKMVKIPRLRWIRLLYLHPKHIDEKILSLIAKEKKICSYLDLPLQHVNDRMLMRMGRNITKKEIIKKIEMIRRKIPDITLRTTFIVGFPSETDKEFNEIIDFIKKYEIDKAGVFTYSREKGTKAYDFENQIPWNVKQKRKKRVINAACDTVECINKKWIGKTMNVLIEEQMPNNLFRGRAESMAPEVDGFVCASGGDVSMVNSFQRVYIDKVEGYDLIGRMQLIKNGIVV